MNKVEESDGNIVPEEEEIGVTDFSVQKEKVANVRLREGFEVERLLQNQGIYLEPEIDEFSYHEENSKQFFSGNEKELDHLISQHGYNSNDEEETFEQKARRMVSITTDGAVKKRVISPGIESDGFVPENGTVTIHYSLSLEDQDEPFDSTYLRGKSERHRLKDNRLIYGLDIAIRSMKNHEKAEFIFEPKYAFGEMGCPPRVPGNSNILARIELLSFFEEGEADALLALNSEERNKQYKFEEVLKVVQKEHRAGNSYAGKNEYKTAAKCYERASKLLEDLELANDEEEEKQKHILLKLYRNRGLCYTKVNWPKKACLVLQDAMVITETDAKLNYRMGIAKRMLCNYKDARKYLMKSLQAEPGNAEIGAELASLDQIIKKERDAQRIMCQRMFMSGKNSTTICESSENHKDSKIEDDDYAEIVEQLECFKNDIKQKDLNLPSDFDPSIIRMIDGIAQQMDLCVVQGKFENQYKVIRRS